MAVCNIGKTDRLIRLIIGIVIIAFGIIINSWIWMFGIIPLITVFTKNCLLYTIFKIDTTKSKS